MCVLTRLVKCVVTCHTYEYVCVVTRHTYEYVMLHINKSCRYTCMWHDLFIGVTWLVGMWLDTESRVQSWRLCSRAEGARHQRKNILNIQNDVMQQKSWDMTLARKDAQHRKECSYVWHDSLMLICMTWLVDAHMCDMTRWCSYVWHDSLMLICVTW